MRFNPVNLVLLVFQPHTQLVLELLSIELLLLLLQDQRLGGLHDVVGNVLQGSDRATATLGFIFIEREGLLLFRQQAEEKYVESRVRFSFVRDMMVLDNKSYEKL